MKNLFKNILHVVSCTSLLSSSFRQKSFLYSLFSFIIIVYLLSLLILNVDGKQFSTKTSGHQKSVKILLNSKWQQTPLYLEVAEYLAEENSNYFWSFLDLVHSDDNKEYLHSSLVNSNQSTQQIQYETSIRLASQLLRSESKLSILKFSISLRSYSPTVAIFWQTTTNLIGQYRQLGDCEWFVELSQPDSKLDNFERFNCKLDNVKKSISSLLDYLKSSDALLSNPLLYNVDHIYPNQASLTKATIILYANVASPSFWPLHQYLAKIATENSLRYVLRYTYSLGPDSRKVALSGFGVELAIKSTEYKAHDDTRVHGEVSNDPQLVKEAEKPDELAGFIFSKLKHSYPKFAEKLDNFHNYLIDTDKEIATLKAWELQEISLQAVTKVLSVQKEEALTLLKDISQNFPSLARSLVKIVVEDDLKKEIVKNQYLFMNSLSLGTSDTVLFVNGLYHDVDSVDIFTLLDLVKQEFSVVNRLYSLLDGDSDRIKNFVKLDVNTDKQDFQVDIRDGAVQYINDIEHDRMYKSWPANLHEMLRPSYPGMLRNIRRNMYHLVLVLDPSKKETFEVLRMAESFYIHKAPVRIGLVFAVNPESSKMGFTDAGVAALEAFNYIAQEKNAHEGLAFLTEVIASASSKGHFDLEPDDVIVHFKIKFKLNNLDDVFGADSPYDTGRKLAWDFIQRTGLGSSALPKALLNGVLLKDSHLNADYFEDAVLTEIMKQTPPIQKAIYRSELSDDDDILDWLMNKNTVMPRLNRIILGLDKNSATGQKNKFIDFTGTVLKSKNNNASASRYEGANINDLQATMASQVFLSLINCLSLIE